MTIWSGLLLGLMIGWVIEWIIDWNFWRPPFFAALENERRLKQELERIESKFAALEQKKAEPGNNLAISNGVHSTTQPDPTGVY